MAYWGMAMANVNNASALQPEFLKEARKRAASLSRRETLYLEALEASYKAGANDKTKRQGWLLGLESIRPGIPRRRRRLVPGWQRRRRGTYNEMDGIGSRQAVDTLIDLVFQAEPMHPGGHHYRIHLWDGHKAARALKSAGLYAATAPRDRTHGICRATPTPS